jgi:hypothetical protein
MMEMVQGLSISIHECIHTVARVEKTAAAAIEKSNDRRFIFAFNSGITFAPKDSSKLFDERNILPELTDVLRARSKLD